VPSPPRFAFVFFNRVVNRLLIAILRSPLHRPLSGILLVITYTGRRSGREFTIVTGYKRTDKGVRIGVDWPERKVWWRNFTEAAGPVRVRVAGTEYAGTAVTEGDLETGVRVDVTLDGWAPA
jgi:hypothetical protein